MNVHELIHEAAYLSITDETMAHTLVAEYMAAAGVSTRFANVVHDSIRRHAEKVLTRRNALYATAMRVWGVLHGA